MRDRLDKSKVFRVADMSQGLLVKLDAAKLPDGYAHEARNFRFQTGAAVGRKGNARLQGVPLPSGCIYFGGTSSDYGYVPVNDSCPLWSGFGPQWTIEFVLRPVAIPAPAAKKQLLEIGGSGYSTIEMYTASGSPYDLKITVRDASMGSGSTYTVGTFDSSGGDYADRRYYVRVRRKGRDLDCLMIGSSSGSQYDTTLAVFTAVGTKMKAATSPIYVGGRGIAGTTAGMYTRIDEFRMWNSWLQDTRPYWFTTHPMVEDANCLCSFGFDEGSGIYTWDRSLWQHRMLLAGTKTWDTGLVTGLSVGQMIATHTDLNEEHRLVAAGGSIYREVIK